MLLFTISALSQSIEGDWYGKLDIQGMQLRLALHVTASGNGYTSTWDSPDQEVYDIPATMTTLEKITDFSFTHAGAGFKYSGNVNPAFTEMTGKS